VEGCVILVLKLCLGLIFIKMDMDSSISILMNMRPKQSLRTEMTHFLSSGTEMTHLHKFEDRP
jgi:hypothetical protein